MANFSADTKLVKVFFPEMGRDVYRLCCSYQDRHIAKNAGFRWEPNRKWWYTPIPCIAAKLILYAATAQLREELRPYAGNDSMNLSLSTATESDIEVPLPPGRLLLPYQRAGIEYAYRNPRTLLADEMGLGKTVQAIGLLNILYPTRTALEGRHLLIVCPAALKWNWKKEITAWSVVEGIQDLVHIPNPRTLEKEGDFTLHGLQTLFDRYPIVILNYDILPRFSPFLQMLPFDVLIADECHYLKTSGAMRTRCLLGGSFELAKKESHFPLLQDKGTASFRHGNRLELPPVHAQRCLFLSGTPLTNRPVELYPVLHYLRPDVFPDFHQYAQRYCGAHLSRYGYNVRGASHLTELHGLLRQTCMVRRQKADVLTQLPPKRYQVYEIAQEQLPRIDTLLREEAQFVRAALEGLKQGNGFFSALAQLAKIRHRLAIQKVPILSEWIEDMLENEEKVVVFVHHRDVGQLLWDRLTRKHGTDSAVLVTGDTPPSQRLERVGQFQKEESTRVFIGSIQAAGVGFTLTEAAHVLFAEMDWVPANLAQAEDRCHRIGQSRPVVISYAVVENSIEQTIATRLAQKASTIRHVLEGVPAPSGVSLEEDSEGYWAARWLTYHENQNVFALT